MTITPPLVPAVIPVNTKIKYINNKELLLEIHNSKKTFCYYIEPKFSNFDTIVHNVSQITPELIEEVRLKKSKPRGKPAISLDDLPPEGIVVRVMTYEHIPLDPDRVRKSRVTDQSYARTSFPPFKHYILLPTGPKEVLRSHWVNGFENGHFVADLGQINDRLARMFMLLVERYARRGNWRGYCVDEDTEALTQRGWLNHTEITTSDTILSFDKDQLAWSSIKSIFRDQYNGKMFHLTGQGIDSLVTPGHKFVTKEGLKPVEFLKESDRMILMADGVEAPTEKTFGDDLVELIGWVVTEGNYFRRGPDSVRLAVYQNEGEYADRIRACLQSLGGQYSEQSRDRLDNGNKNVVFSIGNNIKDKVVAAIGQSKSLPSEFLLKLTQDQRNLLIETMIDGDGWRSSVKNGVTPHVGYCQKNKDHMDAFVMLCTMAGRQLSVHRRDTVSPTGFKSHVYEAHFFSKARRIKRVENINMHGGKRRGQIGKGKAYHPNEPTVDYNGMVWCPETEFGSFIARRNGYVYLSGNTYNDEMQCQALLQLSQIGLQFDESKSDNPFAFYTTAIRNCFTRVLNLEKKVQNIRDDMLIIAGASPSYTRQIDNELEYRFPSEKSTEGPKRKAGAPKKVVADKSPPTVIDDE
jgi:hypothetical protein